MAKCHKLCTETMQKTKLGALQSLSPYCIHYADNSIYMLLRLYLARFQVSAIHTYVYTILLNKIIWEKISPARSETTKAPQRSISSQPSFIVKGFHAVYHDCAQLNLIVQLTFDLVKKLQCDQ